MLQNAFDPAVDGQGKDVSRRDDLISRLERSSETGRALIGEARKRNVRIGLSDEVGAACGLYRSSEKLILMNKSYDDDMLLPNLAHECRHSMQDIDAFAPEHSVRSAITITRAKEADAFAHECAAVFEMRSEEVGVYLDFMENNPEVFRPFVQAYNKNGSLDEAKAAAFEAFYTDETFVKTYDSRTVSFYEKGMKPGKKEVSGRELCDKIAPYMTPDFFNRDSARRLAPEIEKRLAPLTGKTSAPSVVKNRCAER